METRPDPADSLETARLRLRCPVSEDAESVSELMTSSVSRWVASWPIPFTVEMAIERIAATRQAFIESRSVAYAIERRSDGVLLGWIAIARQNASERRAMLGYWMGEAHQGHGYMREAAPAAVAEAFRILDLDVIEAAAQPENKTSFAVLRGCGMTHVGERTIFASARLKNELCLLYEFRKPGVRSL